MKQRTSKLIGTGGTSHQPKLLVASSHKTPHAVMEFKGMRSGSGVFCHVTCGQNIVLEVTVFCA